MASVIDIATDQEVEEFFTSNLSEMPTEKIIDNAQVEFNEDNDYLESIQNKKSNVEIKTNVSEI
jgi:hypothetical protein